MPLRHHRRQYAQLFEFERGRIIGMMEAWWLAQRVDRSDLSDCDEVLGPVDRRDVVYMATRLRTRSTN
ncbi:hypothetical protein TNCV_2191761 [Trichonephila clavipes]|nr:hypothetical protein TNCV_2191761 [Trichonephila clavipes]